LWVSLVTFATITLCVASQRVFIIVVYFIINSVWKLLDTHSYELVRRTCIPSVHSECVVNMCVAFLEGRPWHFHLLGISNFSLSNINLERWVGNVFTKTLDRHSVFSNLTGSKWDSCETAWKSSPSCQSAFKHSLPMRGFVTHVMMACTTLASHKYCFFPQQMSTNPYKTYKSCEMKSLFIYWFSTYIWQKHLFCNPKPSVTMFCYENLPHRLKWYLNAGSEYVNSINFQQISITVSSQKEKFCCFYSWHLFFITFYLKHIIYRFWP